MRGWTSVLVPLVGLGCGVFGGSDANGSPQAAVDAGVDSSPLVVDGSADGGGFVDASGPVTVTHLGQPVPVDTLMLVDLTDATDINTGGGPNGANPQITRGVNPPVTQPWLYVDETGAVAMVVRSWSVAATQTVKVHGGHPLVVVSLGDVNIAGLIDAGASKTTPGPGGAAPGAGMGMGKNGGASGNGDGGGGGAGFGTAGAIGQTGGGNAMPGAAGAAYGTYASLAGGSGGGTGSRACGDPGGQGGGGGGALQITSFSKIAIAGKINAGGGGGHGGCLAYAGGGGGSGGSIVLEGVSGVAVAASAVLAANGGGGGGGGGVPSNMNSSGGYDGSDGTAVGKAANGGQDEGTCGSCPGGAGGFGMTAPTSDATPSGTNAGGGGGAVGHIWLRTRASTGMIATSGAVLSPPPQTLLDL